MLNQDTDPEWRESPKQTVKGEGYYNRQGSGGPDCWAYCVPELGPLPQGQGFVFENLMAKDEMPVDFALAIEDGARIAMQEGVAKGYPIVDVYVALVSAKINEVDSGDFSFKTAGFLAFRDACSKAEMVILEPMAIVTITTPQQFADSIQADLKQQRGEILRQEELLNNLCLIEASVPLGETLGYRVGTTNTRPCSGNDNAQWLCRSAPLHSGGSTSGKKNTGACVA